MTTSTFDKRVLIEQLRYIEAQDALPNDADDVAAEMALHSDFDERLWQRARRLVDRNELGASLARAARLSRIANSAALLLAAVLGALATSYAVTGGHTINIYWLLLVLLGFNLLSMLLWLVGISLNLDGLIAGVLAKITSWLPSQLTEKSKSAAQADRAWLACHFGGRVGKWQFSKITHQLWLVYLLAGLAMLLLILIARQYDFVWGTTLLSDSAFVTLTEALNAPLQALGFSTPSAEQVEHTRIGAQHSLTAAHRSSWAQFLLGALLVFGIVPRLLLWCWAMLMRAVSRRRFALDYYLPYYISLRQQLLPLAGHGEIVDADSAPPGIAEAPVINSSAHTVPPEAHWVAVELGDDISWPPKSIGDGVDLGQVSDRESLARVLQSLENGARPAIAVAVTAARPPDRGVQRTIANLLSTGVQPWLVLLQNREHDAVSNTRLEAWYRLAEACHVPADHVVSMSAA
ncbi:MAG: DUF2868 domain-containing protein [Pseudomonadales bacterium]